MQHAVRISSEGFNRAKRMEFADVPFDRGAVSGRRERLSARSVSIRLP